MLRGARGFKKENLLNPAGRSVKIFNTLGTSTDLKMDYLSPFGELTKSSSQVTKL
jgi:hypothetical protein